MNLGSISNLIEKGHFLYSMYVIFSLINFVSLVIIDLIGCQLLHCAVGLQSSHRFVDETVSYKDYCDTDTFRSDVFEEFIVINDIFSSDF